MMQDKNFDIFPIENLVRLMVEYGADPSQRVVRNEDHIWWHERPKKLYSTTFHIYLSIDEPFKNTREQTLRLFVHHCNDFEATDSDGVGIQEWADSVDPEMGAFLR
ncbi:hypothetical protein IMSHALPRED_005223 [Imshaugia aleurites]|uniref:Uncharacterized protein n=1 Tax=Imshaugia aleurites TaxID=172621 RepID=A0A8H3FAB2_9LECA|nr:hypothetical protein IMSHALPRED_005223 [Imshaugia aleurites]